MTNYEALMMKLSLAQVQLLSTLVQCANVHPKVAAEAVDIEASCNQDVNVMLLFPTAPSVPPVPNAP